MKDITEILERAGFEDVESFCNTYMAKIPGTKITAIITVSDKEIHYSGTFHKVYKKQKDLEKLFREIVLTEKERAKKYKGSYDTVLLTSDGKMYIYYGGNLIIVDNGNKTTVIINEKKHTVSTDAEQIISIIEAYGDKDKAIEHIKMALALI